MHCSFQLPESMGFVSLCGHRPAFAAANRQETDSGCVRKADLMMQDESGQSTAPGRHEVAQSSRIDKGGVGGVEVGDLCEVVRWPSENKGPQR
jgi:hypothetical protein